MADNISVTQGFGTAMATDEVDGVHYPRTKIVFGAPDSQPQDVSSASRLPVDTDIDVSALATESTLASVDGKLDALATEETLASVDEKLDTLATISGKLDALATEATLTSIDGKLDALATEATLTSIDGKLDALATEATLTSIDGKLDALATEATLTSVDGKLDALATEATLTSIDGKLDALATEETLLLVASRLVVGQPSTARQLAAGATSSSVSLTNSIRRVSIYASGADIRYAVGTGSQTASATSHYIAQGERISIAVPASAQIAATRANATDGTLEITELS